MKQITDKTIDSLARHLEDVLSGFGPEVLSAYEQAFNRWLVLDLHRKPVYEIDPKTGNLFPVIGACKFLGVL